MDELVNSKKKIFILGIRLLDRQLNPRLPRIAQNNNCLPVDVVAALAALQRSSLKMEGELGPLQLLEGN